MPCSAIQGIQGILVLWFGKIVNRFLRFVHLLLACCDTFVGFLTSSQTNNERFIFADTFTLQTEKIRVWYLTLLVLPFLSGRRRKFNFQQFLYCFRTFRAVLPRASILIGLF